MNYSSLVKNSYTRRLYLVSLLASLLICTAYILSRSFPSGLVGLFFEASDALIENSWVIPEKIQNYSVGGVPFAYSPLPFYISSTAHSIGIEYDKFALIYSPLILFGCSIAISYMVFKITNSKISAIISPTILTCHPSLLVGHITAGGFVRSTALLLCALSVIYCYKYCKSKDTYTLLLTSTFVALTILSHPTYGVQATLSVIVVLGYFRDGKSILNRCFKIGTLAFAIIAPWIFYITSLHGVTVFLNAGSSQGGIFPGVSIISYFDPTSGGLLVTTLYMLFMGGIMLSLAHKNYLVVMWGVACLFVLPSQGGKGHMLALLTAVSYLLGEGIVKKALRVTRKSMRPYLFTGFLVPLVLLGLCYTTDIDSKVLGSVSVPFEFMDGPQTVKKSDLTMYQWASKNTPARSKFIPIGSGAGVEGFPYWSQRTMVLTVWGSEWLPPYVREFHLESISKIRNCVTAQCIKNVIVTVNSTLEVKTDYVFFSDTRNKISEQSRAEIVASIISSNKLRLIYNKRGKFVAEVLYE